MAKKTEKDQKAEKAPKQAVDGRGLAFTVDVVAAVLAVAGTVVMFVSTMLSSAYTVSNIALLAVMGVAGAALAVVAALMSTKESTGIVSLLCAMGSIVLCTLVVGMFMNARVILISGLLSWNSGNAVGWQVLYVSIAAVVCYVLADLALIIASFMGTGKTVKAAGAVAES